MPGLVRPFQEIADAIRLRGGTVDYIKAKEFAQAIMDIPSTAPYVAIMDVTAPNGTIVIAISDTRAVQGTVGDTGKLALQIPTTGTWRVVGVIGSTILGPVVVENVAVFEADIPLIPEVKPKPIIPVTLEWNSAQFIGAIEPTPVSYYGMSGSRAKDTAVFVHNNIGYQYDAELVRTTLTHTLSMRYAVPIQRHNKATFLYGDMGAYMHEIDDEGVLSLVTAFDRTGTLQIWDYDPTQDLLFIGMRNNYNVTETVDSDNIRHSLTAMSYGNNSSYYGNGRAFIWDDQIIVHDYNRQCTYSLPDWVQTTADVTITAYTYINNTLSKNIRAGDNIVWVQTNILMRYMSHDGTLHDMTVSPVVSSNAISTVGTDSLYGCHFVVTQSSNSSYYSNVNYQACWYFDDDLTWQAPTKPLYHHGYNNTVILGEWILLGPGNYNSGTNVDLYRLMKS